jgi:hypothetical protein
MAMRFSVLLEGWEGTPRNKGVSFLRVYLIGRYYLYVNDGTEKGLFYFITYIDQFLTEHSGLFVFKYHFSNVQTPNV